MDYNAISKSQKKILQHEIVSDVFKLIGVELTFIEDKPVFSTEDAIIDSKVISTNSDFRIMINLGNKTVLVSGYDKSDPSLGSCSVCDIELRGIESGDKKANRVLYSVEHSFEKDPSYNRISFKAFEKTKEKPYLRFVLGNDRVEISNFETILMYNNIDSINRELESIGMVTAPTLKHLLRYTENSGNFAYSKKKMEVNMCKFINGEIRPYFINIGFRDYSEARGHGVFLTPEELEIVYNDFTEKAAPNNFLMGALQLADSINIGTMDFLLSNSQTINSFKQTEDDTSSIFQKKF